jgi:hypothetical protein
MKLGIIKADERNRLFKGIEKIAFHTTIKLQRDLAIGSKYSQGDFPLYHRDNSFISWKVNWRGRNITCYGQVVVYYKYYDWIDIIVVVKRYNKINKNSFNQLFIKRNNLDGLTTIKHTEIINIISRIGINKFGKEILYLVLNHTKIIFEVYSMICNIISKFANY